MAVNIIEFKHNKEKNKKKKDFKQNYGDETTFSGMIDSEINSAKNLNDLKIKLITILNKFSKLINIIQESK